LSPLSPSSLSSPSSPLFTGGHATCAMVARVITRVTARVTIKVTARVTAGALVLLCCEYTAILCTACAFMPLVYCITDGSVPSHRCCYVNAGER
jgi:hypothetical protein